MSRFLMIITVVISASAAMAVATDAELRRILFRATQYIDDPHGGPGEVRYAIQVSDYDTNRVVSLMKQLIAEGTEDAETTMFYLSEIGKHASSADLPFLYQHVSTTNLCDAAVRAVLQAEGVSTNSVERICALLPVGNATNCCVVDAWLAMTYRVKNKCTDPYVRALMISNAIDNASRQNVYPERIDKSILRIDPTYRMSKRRLAVLRSVRDLGPNEWQTNFVTRTIHELESYPEANLPE